MLWVKRLRFGTHPISPRWKRNLVLPLRIALYEYRVLKRRAIVVHGRDCKLETGRSACGWFPRPTTCHHRTCSASETRRLRHFLPRGHAGHSKKSHYSHEYFREAACPNSAHKDLLVFGQPHRYGWDRIHIETRCILRRPIRFDPTDVRRHGLTAEFLNGGVAKGPRIPLENIR